MIPAFVLKWWPALAGAAVVVAPSFLVGQCSGKNIARQQYEAARAVANVEVLKEDGDIKEVLAAQQKTDDALVNEVKKELTDAVSDLPDTLPSARRVALACARLRAQGTDTATLPACGGFAGGGEAAPRPLIPQQRVRP